MNMLLKKIRDYIYLYRPLQNYYGADFKRIFNFVERSKDKCREEIEAYKLERLRRLVEHARRSVPYYRELFKQHEIRPEDINSFEDYARIPVLTKKLLRENLDRLKSDDFNSYKPILTETSGTTGQVTRLYRSSYHEAYRKAVVWRFYRQLGHDFRQPWVSLNNSWGYNKNARLYEFDKIENCLNINIYHVMEGRYRQVVEAIRAFRPNMILAHPNILCAIADYFERENLKPIEAPVIITYGEKIYQHMRPLLIRGFQGRYAEYFGNRENSVGAFGDSSGCFNEISEYCHLEPANSDCICGFDSCGELISTSLHNYCVPLIRYDTEDLICWKGYCDGEKYPGFELLGGRGKDLLLSRDGLVVPYTPSILESADNSRIRKYQISQDDIDHVTLRVVADDNYVVERDEPLLIEQFNLVLAKKFKISIEYIEDIPFTRNGKYRVSVSPLTMKYLGSDSSKEIAG